MAYLYQVSFDVSPEQLSELEIGSPTARLLGYLRAVLPAEPGFISARAMYSIDTPETVHLLFESFWEDWDHLQEHLGSPLDERRLLEELQPRLALQGLSSTIYSEVP